MKTFSFNWKQKNLTKTSPTWVHFDRRYGTPACTAGYPELRQGSRGVYVLVAQDGLNTLGYKAGSLDGIYGTATRNAVANYQKARGLISDGILGCNTWRSLQEDVVGNGRTANTID